MKNKLKIALTAGLILMAAIALITYLKGRNQLPAESVYVSGIVEATEVRLSFQVAGIIEEILTDEGKWVNKGEVVARIDTEELLKIKAQAQAALKEAELQHQRLKEDLERAENLYAAGAVPAYKRDAVKTDFDVAKSKIENLRASLDLTELRLGYAQLASPIDGFVLVKSAEPGEYAHIGSSVLTIADIRDAWLTGYINETDLGKVKLNQEVDIRIDTFPDKVYKGRISFISQEAEFTPKHIQTKEERIKLVYRIKITVDNSNMDLKPGMPADAYIITKESP